MTQAVTGWLLDVYAAEEGAAGPDQGVTVWLLADDGRRLRLHQPFPITFYATGPARRLRELWRYLQTQPAPVRLARTERRDLFAPQPVSVLAVEVACPADQPPLFQRVAEAFPDLTYYDADLSLPLRYAAVYRVFPLARCTAQVGPGGRLWDLQALDLPWELDPAPPPLRILYMEPDCDPAHAEPKRVTLRCGRHSYCLDLHPPRPLLINLRAILQRHNPDLIVSAWGDTWLLPLLLELSAAWNLPLPLSRDPDRHVAQRSENSYFSYGQIIYVGQQVHLFGRWHLDINNAFLYDDYGLEGVLELARVSSLPVQTAARVSPGSGISAMQMLTALRLGILVPWRKQQAEHLKTALDLLRADQGGLVYQPLIGLHADVAAIDFISMYPSIMVHFNISPETVQTPFLQGLQPPPAAPLLPADGRDPEAFFSPLRTDAESEERAAPGLIPQTLAPLLQKRMALKVRLGNLPRWHPQRKTDEARAMAHKWLLVTCFGYLGYKNARFGRIEAHEAVTACGREILLRAKEAAEDLGCTVLHLYVDGLWVQKPGARTPADFLPVLNAILERTGLPAALDGVYRWVAFLPSRQDARVPVANRYFGVFQDGSLKYRGIEARRHDTPPFIAEVQLELLKLLARAPDADALPASLPGALALLRRRLWELKAGRVRLEKLLVTQKLSREPEEYRSPSPVARAVGQLQAVGKSMRPGQYVRFLYTRGDPGVYAWDLPVPANPAIVDIARYVRLLLRAAAAVLGPLGLDEEALRAQLVQGGKPLAFPMPTLASPTLSSPGYKLEARGESGAQLDS